MNHPEDNNTIHVNGTVTLQSSVPNDNITINIIPPDAFFDVFFMSIATSGLAIGIIDIIGERVRRRMFGHNRLHPGHPQFMAQLNGAAPAAMPRNHPLLGFGWNELTNADLALPASALAALLVAIRRAFPAYTLLNLALIPAFAGLGIGIIDIIRIERVRRRAVERLNPAQAAELVAAMDAMAAMDEMAAIPPNQLQLGFGENLALRHAVQEAERSMRELLQEAPELRWHLELAPLILAKHRSVDKILEHFASAPANLKSIWLHDMRLKNGSELAKILAAVPRQVQYLLLSQDLLDNIAIKGMCKDIDFCHATTDDDQHNVLTEKGIEDFINTGEAIILKRNDPNQPRHFHEKLRALTKGKTPPLNDDVLSAISKFLTFRDAAKISLSEALPRPMEANLSQLECVIDKKAFLFC